MKWELKSDRPIFSQLVEEVEIRIISGIYAPGDKLPSVRELASEAAVNPNTMQRAFAELEQNGLVHAQRTIGRFITEDIVMISKAKDNLAIERIKEFIAKMKTLGFDKNEIMALINSAYEE